MTPSRLIGALVACIVVAGLCAGILRYAKRNDTQLFGEVFQRAHTRDRVTALTFDDGPREPDTRALLDVLDREQVRATFFMVGRAIERYPELAREVVRRGHQVGNHSYSHTRMLLVSPQFCRDEIARTDTLLRQAGATGPIHFRAPFGEKLWSLPWVLAEMERLDEPGAVIALHDGGGPRDQTVAAVQRLIPSLRNEGYRFLTVDELRAVDGR
jgi:peptidoglycan/xylan/chitin deacetylase (PgdA/CDA1 family)